MERERAWQSTTRTRTKRPKNKNKERKKSKFPNKRIGEIKKDVTLKKEAGIGEGECVQDKRQDRQEERHKTDKRAEKQRKNSVS